MSKKDRGKQQLMQNSIIYTHYYNRLTMLALSMFKWNNLPDTIDPIWMERKQLVKGKMLFFEDDVKDLRVLECTLSGPLDLSDEPIIRTAFAPNGFYGTYNKGNSVVCYNNVLRSNSIMDIQMYAEKLWQIESTMDVNINSQKMPIIITGKETQMNMLKNVAMNYDNFCHYVFGDDSIDLNKAITVLKTDSPYIADKLQELKTQVWNEALTTLGISNINLSKKERLVSNEVDVNMGGVIAQQYLRLEPRQEACEKINKMFKTNISVEFRNEILINNGGEKSE